MAVPILPVIKTLAPYVAQIATAAIPAFTSKPVEGAKSNPIITKQIQELQDAATRNAETINGLAEKLNEAMNEIEKAANDAQGRLAAYKTILFSSLGLSAISLMICVYLLLR